MSTSCHVSEKIKKNTRLSRETFLLFSVLFVTTVVITMGKFYSILCID